MWQASHSQHGLAGPAFAAVIGRRDANGNDVPPVIDVDERDIKTFLHLKFTMA